MLEMINKEVLDIESETLVNILTCNGEPIVKKYSRLDYSNEFVAHVVNKLRDDGYDVELVDKRELIVRRREK